MKELRITFNRVDGVFDIFQFSTWDHASIMEVIEDCMKREGVVSATLELVDPIEILFD